VDIDAVIGLMINWFHCSIQLKLHKGLLNFNELDQMLSYFDQGKELFLWEGLEV
jgi:hypothetical protein